MHTDITPDIIPYGMMDTKQIDAAAFGSTVRRSRRQQRLTQRQLATIAGVGERFVVELESGKPSCELGRALQVASRLGLRLELHMPIPEPDSPALPDDEPGDIPEPGPDPS